MPAMEPEAEAQADPEAPESIATAAAEEAAPEASPGGGDEWDEAFSSASAEFGERPTADASEGGQDSPTGDSAATPSDAGEAATPQAQPTPEESRYSVQGALRRINSLMEQGRAGELTPEERGELTRLKTMFAPEVRSEVEESIETERKFRELYLDLDMKFNEDKAAFTDIVAENPDYLNFYRAYKADHPDLSYETAGEARAFNEDQLRAAVRDGERQTRSRIGTELKQAMKEIATEHGVDFEAIEKSGKGTGSMLAATVEAAASKKAASMVEKELPARVAEETKALVQERDALRLRVEGPGTTRTIRSIERDPAAQKGDVKSFDDLGDAYRSTKELLGIG